jgi:hypothetical protein
MFCLNNCYFWDNIFYTAKLGNWFYSSLNSAQTLSPQEIILTTGFFPPLMGIMTGGLWAIFGRELWVSHLFIFLWAIILMYNSWKLIRLFFPKKQANWVLLIALLESTLLAQFSIAGLDFILFTAFVVSLRAIFENKKWLLAIGMFFLCLIHIRGLFTGIILLIANYYYLYLNTDKKPTVKLILKSFLPYFPALLFAFSYLLFFYLANISQKAPTSLLSDVYDKPTGFLYIVKHFIEFGMRTVENGRIVIWLFGFYVVYKGIKSKSELTQKTKMLVLFFVLINGLYLFFVIYSRMFFAARYFMPQFFVLTILSLLELRKYVNEKKLKLVFILVLCLELTGNFWIYPEKISKSWDCTLAHLPYYNLRKQCFDYIDQKKLNYTDISAGFSIYGDRNIIELSNSQKSIGSELNTKYFIYSNISNLPDDWIDEIKNEKRWKPIKSFKEGFVFITIYKNSNY